MLDLCRTVPIEQAVAAGDRALAFGLVRESWRTTLPRCPVARNPAGEARCRPSTLGESAGEPVSRVRLHEEGPPAPELQQAIYGQDGRFVARVDFCWKEERTIGEFDGKIKYGRVISPGSRSRTCPWRREPRRCSFVILVGRSSARLWEDPYRPGAIKDRVRAPSHVPPDHFCVN